MDIFKSDIQDITPLNIDGELKEKLNDGIQYVFSVVTKLQEDSPDDKYEMYGILGDNWYNLSIQAESYSKLHSKRGWITYKGMYYLLLQITYKNFTDRPKIYISLINARENLLSGNSIIDISKKFGKKINASELSLTDGSELTSICKGYHFSMTYLYILSSGISWYNSKGFISRSFEEERQHNLKLLSLNIIDFLDAQYIYKINHMKKKIKQTIEEFEEEKRAEPEKFYSKLELFFDFFKKYTKQYPFLVKTGLTLSKDMTVQEFFTRIKLFVFRNLPKKKTNIYEELCSQLDWLFGNIQIEIIEPDSDVIQLSLDNPKIILYSDGQYYDIDEPKIPSLLNIRVKTPSNISRRRTNVKSKSKSKSKSRRRTIG
jgi:hypothetical protein